MLSSQRYSSKQNFWMRAAALLKLSIGMHPHLWSGTVAIKQISSEIEIPKSNVFDPAGLYRWQTISAHVPVSRSTWYARIKAGQAPEPVLGGMKSRAGSAWRGADILNWLANPNDYRAQN